ncbi:MAG TPA: signal recognition particle-docking protein FtsY [Ruminococcaceae bacterium]|nr:signal recognition particle-docking protein FtsY [Oscillospiraceae bacterium]
MAAWRRPTCCTASPCRTRASPSCWRCPSPSSRQSSESAEDDRKDQRMGLFSKIRDGLKKTRESMGASMNSMLHSFTRIDDDLFESLEELLVMGDVGVPTAERICADLKKQVKERGVTDPAQITGMLKKTVADILRGGEELDLSTKPSIVLVVGVNGVGKTTTVGKLAAMLTGRGKKVILAAADTFRAAATEQLEVWARRSGAEMVSQSPGSDPASVVFDSIAAAKARGADVVLCDTAGRLHNKKNLMDELAKIDRVIRREAPDCAQEVLLVLDAATGQNAVNQAREFKASAPVTGIVLTKLDGTPRGGVILAIREELGLPVKFIGVGEQADDLQPFDADQFAEALFAEQE